jgi:hypothetical protein
MKRRIAIALSANVAGVAGYLLFRPGLYDGVALVIGVALGVLLIRGLWKRPGAFLGNRDDAPQGPGRSTQSPRG